jgi:hypothetical protein
VTGVAWIAAAATAAPGAAASTARTRTSSTTIVVDPSACAVPAPHPNLRVVCRPAQVGFVLRDGGTVVLRTGVHHGSLDVRGRHRITIRGDRGAVLDAAGARYALSLRGSRSVTVRSLALRGGTAQTVWVERSVGVRLDRLSVTESAGAGVQAREVSDLTVVDSRIERAAGAGLMELTGVRRSRYLRLRVQGNGRGRATYNGDGLQLAGSDVTVRDVVTTGNGSDARYEHGIYVSAAARDVRLDRVRSAGNSGVAVKLGGNGILQRSVLDDDRLALYCGTTSGSGWLVRSTELIAPQGLQASNSCAVTVDS